LQKNGHLLLAQNFKTKFGEIDLITKKDQKVYLHEVKVSRTNNSYPFHNWNSGQKRRMINAFRYCFKMSQIGNYTEIKICFIWFAFINPNRLKLIMYNQDIETDL
jgi:Holliday junction resolvase-like predicted endonuclease